MTITDIPAGKTAQDDRRAAYARGLRALADALEASPGALPLPHDGTLSPVTLYFLSGEDPRAALAAAARALPCDFRKEVTDRGDGTDTLRLLGSLHGLEVELVAYRADVCERVVTGTRKVTERVKDPEVLAEVPEVEVTRVVEDVQWICQPVMASRPASVQDGPAELEAGEAA